MSCGRSCHGCEHNMSDGCNMPYSDRDMGAIYDDHHNVVGCTGISTYEIVEENIETVNYGKVRCENCEKSVRYSNEGKICIESLKPIPDEGHGVICNRFKEKKK